MSLCQTNYETASLNCNMNWELLPSQTVGALSISYTYDFRRDETGDFDCRWKKHYYSNR